MSQDESKRSLHHDLAVKCITKKTHTHTRVLSRGERGMFSRGGGGGGGGIEPQQTSVGKCFLRLLADEGSCRTFYIFPRSLSNVSFL